MAERGLFSQLLIFAAVGIAATATHYAVALLLLERAALNIYAANLAGYGSAVMVSFFGHGVLTFQVKPQRRVFGRFLLVSIVALAGSNAILVALELGTDFPAALRLAIVVLVVPLLSFFANKMWVYRRLPEHPVGMNKVKLACSVALLAGLYCSLMVVTSLASVDPDSSHSLILWQGIREHGLAWLLDWKFTQDNWLLSLFPWHFLGYFVAGSTPAVALLGGWLIFVLAACTAGLLAWQLQARRAALMIPPVLLLLGLHAHVKGLAAYSTTHNVTNLYGLLALVLIVRWLRHRSRSTLLAVFVVLFAGAVSDPWMLAAWNLPLAIATLWLLVARSGGIGRADSASLLAVNLFCIGAVMTRGFGLPAFFPAMEFQSGGVTAIIGNFSFLLRELGGLLNLVPGHAGNLLLSALLSLLVVGLWLLVLLARSFAAGQLARGDLQFFVLTGFFSIGGVTLAFALNDSATFTLSARFLINVPYVLVTGLGVLLEHNWARLRRPERRASASLVLLFVLAGATSTYPYWSRPVAQFNVARVSALSEFLRAENLSYGYGPYWGASANPVTAVSGGEIIIRPVVFDPATGMLSDTWRSQTSRRWYRAADIPPGQQQFFVFVVADGEECADPRICIAGLTRQFGPPLRTLAYGSSTTVLVWDRPLTDAWTFGGSD